MLLTIQLCPLPQAVSALAAISLFLFCSKVFLWLLWQLFITCIYKTTSWYHCSIWVGSCDSLSLACTADAAAPALLAFHFLCLRRRATGMEKNKTSNSCIVIKIPLHHFSTPSSFPEKDEKLAGCVNGWGWEKKKGDVRGIYMYLKGGRIHHDGAMNYHTERGWDHPQAEDWEYRFYKEELSVTREEKGWRLRRWWIRWTSIIERRKNWEKSRRNSTDDWCLLAVFVSVPKPQTHSSGKAGLRTAVTYRALMPALLKGTIFAFCWAGLGWVHRWVCTWWCWCQHSSCWLTSSQTDIIQQPLCQHIPAAGIAAVIKHENCPDLWYKPKEPFHLEPVSVLALSSKPRAEVCSGFILTRLCMSFARGVCHQKLNLQSPVLSHPSSSLTSCALKLFCRSSNTFVSALPFRRLAC